MLRWNNAQYPVSRGEIIRQLPGAGVRKAGFGLEPVGESVLVTDLFCSSASSSFFSTSMRNCETACDNSAVRPGASPSQNGIPGGCPWASSTRTVPELIRRIRQEALPSWKISPAMLSTAKSSLTVPIKLSPGSSSTR